MQIHRSNFDIDFGAEGKLDKTLLKIIKVKQFFSDASIKPKISPCC